MDIIIGNICSLLAMGTDSLSSTRKTTRDVLLVQCLSQLIYGIGCGLLTVFIRYFGGYPEGVSYAIVLMNILTPLIDRIVPRYFGKQKKEAKG